MAKLIRKEIIKNTSKKYDIETGIHNYYANGILAHNCIGVDYTKNISKMGGVVKSLSIPYTGVVKGEIVLSHKNKDKYFSEFKNARNCATGIYHRLNGEDCEKLDFIAWDAFPTNEENYFSTQEELFKFLENEKFKVTPHKLWKNLTGEKSVNRIHEVWESELPNYDYDCDGLVWKKNEIDWEDLKTNESIVISGKLFFYILRKRTMIFSYHLHTSYHASNGNCCNKKVR